MKLNSSKHVMLDLEMPNYKTHIFFIFHLHFSGCSTMCLMNIYNIEKSSIKIDDNNSMDKSSKIFLQTFELLLLFTHVQQKYDSYVTFVAVIYLSTSKLILCYVHTYLSLKLLVVYLKCSLISETCLLWHNMYNIQAKAIQK